MNDTEKIKNDKSIADFRMLEEDKEKGTRVYYMEMKLPLMKNRTAVLDCKVLAPNDGKDCLMLS